MVDEAGQDEGRVTLTGVTEDEADRVAVGSDAAAVALSSFHLLTYHFPNSSSDMLEWVM